MKQSHLERKIKQEQEKREKELKERLMNDQDKSEIEDNLKKPIINDTVSELNLSSNKAENDKISNNPIKQEKSGNNISDMLENELKSLRKNQDKMFFNFETNCKVSGLLYF